ncbi:tRNA lysidine(34) synthetase TilS [Rhodobacteraceae bacterium F11138]|nr:tRNA lysidine(34) synthetase TilS [Rhodobacteraceae bacterium F11138]
MLLSRSDAEILAHVRARLGGDLPTTRLGVAVSGGGDSVALMHILSRCFAEKPVALHIATVDHGLRPEAAAEAETVAAMAHRLGLPHDTLRWVDRDPGGNLQDQARQARYRLLRDWARGLALDAVALGHTADDQAETVLMRLARSSGVDGLSAMSTQKTLFGLNVIRPLLDLTREDLRSYLRQQGMTWIEDASNDDPRFERVRVRAALVQLNALGLTTPALAGVAANMSQARKALDHGAYQAAGDVLRMDGGDIVLDAEGFRDLPRETARRILVRGLIWIGGGAHPPRRAATQHALNAIRNGREMTLAGCRILCQRGTIRLCREYAAVRRMRVASSECWDGRWHALGNSGQGIELAALGASGLMQCPDWRATGRPRAALMATPGLWHNDRLIAAPTAGWPQGWALQIDCGRGTFRSSLLSH